MQNTSGDASNALSVAETRGLSTEELVATVGNRNQYLDSPLLRLSDEIIAELTRSLEAMRTARRNPTC